MDIVDTFNHLIPTEQLDDALFLESNLENEVCEDFSTSQNVLEDSLKNMLSDKDPMLGSASAQFCLPVLDSNDPNFQMPCSTVIGLDDTMDEEGVKESGNDAIDDDELALPNRNLRSRAEEASVTSPRKSPRLMAQEPVRSLRQSTLAKRSNVAPPLNTKKSSVKSGSAPKNGQKQERSPIKETDVAARLKTEQPREVRRSTRRSGQLEGAAAAVTASQSNTKCLSGPEDVKEIKSETPEQAEVEETSQELSCANLREPCSPSPEETKEIVEVAMNTGSGSAESVCSVSADTEMIPVKNETSDVIDSMGLENSSEEKTVNKAEESEKKAEEHNQIEITGKDNDSSSACLNTDGICETFSNSSSSVKEGVDCSSGSHSVEILDENVLSVKECVAEAGGDDKGMEKTETPSEKLLDSTDCDNKDLKNKEFTSADPGNSILESAVVDQSSQNVQQQIDSTKVEGQEASKFQDDEKQIGISKCEKNIRPRHSKSVVQNKQNLTAGTRQKSGSVQQEMTRSRTRAGVAVSGLHSPSSASLKRNADEQESHQHPSNPVKIRKKQSDLGLKAKSSISGVTVKKQTNTKLKKIPRVQASGQTQKLSVQKASEKSPTHQSCSKDTHHSVHSLSGHVSHPGQKQASKHQLATGLKANNSTKEEAETKDPSVEHLKEDDKEKNKSKRNDRNLQPRQRRSSKSLSLDEPPLFIPDNISTVKKEGLEHTSASESKHIWVPSKQCGFCKKPHGNSFTSSNPALQHG